MLVSRLLCERNKCVGNKRLKTNVNISLLVTLRDYTRLSFNQPYTFRLGNASRLLLVFKDQTDRDYMICLVTVEALPLCTH